jgi:hypothetical protein
LQAFNVLFIALVSLCALKSHFDAHIDRFALFTLNSHFDRSICNDCDVNTATLSVLCRELRGRDEALLLVTTPSLLTSRDAVLAVSGYRDGADDGDDVKTSGVISGSGGGGGGGGGGASRRGSGSGARRLGVDALAEHGAASGALAACFATYYMLLPQVGQVFATVVFLFFALLC